MRSQAIFNAIVAAVTGLTTTEDRVYPNRVYAIPNDEITALTVLTGPDELLNDNYSVEGFIDREFTVTVRIHVKATETDLENQVLQIEREIWVALMAEPRTLGLSYVHQIFPSGRDNPDLDDQGEKPTLTADTVWRVHYRHSVIDPGA